MVGLEISSDLVRGVRIGKKKGEVEVPVTAGSEPEALAEAIRRLGGNDPIHIAFRTLPGATTKLVEDLRAVTDHVPIPARELTWEGVKVPGGRTFLLAAARSRLEEALDSWGVTEKFSGNLVGVGITGAAFVALAEELPPDATLLWADPPRFLLLERRAGGLVRFDSPDGPAGVDFVTGPGAEAVAAALTKARVHRPGGFDPRFAVAYGAARWGGEAFPAVPNLEPRERREARAVRRAAIRSTRYARAASVAMILCAAGVTVPARLARADSERTSLEVEADRVAAEAAFRAAAERLRGAASQGAEPGPRIAGVLARMAEAGVVAREIRYEAGPSGPYPGLSPNGSTIVIEGTARDLASLERLRSELGTAVIEESARTGTGMRFRMRVK